MVFLQRKNVYRSPENAGLLGNQICFQRVQIFASTTPELTKTLAVIFLIPVGAGCLFFPETDSYCKQPLEKVLQNSYSYNFKNFLKIHRKIPVSDIMGKYLKIPVSLTLRRRIA